MSNIVKLPGLIDIHVHFRDPGEIHKEDFYTGTSAALSSGITTVFDMPNNKKPIFTERTLKEKVKVVQKKAVCDWALYFGTDGKNLHEFEKVKDDVVGLKVYLNVTTGNLIIKSEESVEEIFYSWPKEKVIVFHAERESIDLAIDSAKRYGNKIHITHVGTGADLEKILSAKGEGIKLTCDVTPHHLFLTKEKISQKDTSEVARRVYPVRNSSDGGRISDRLSSESFYQVKPSLATKQDQDYLWQNLKEIDCIASDHAPHTEKEKQSANPLSGLPGVETMLPLLLTAVREKRLRIDDLIRLTHTNPQKIFGFKQSSHTYIEVDLDRKYKIKNQELFTKCGWSPYDGWEVYGKVKRVFMRGEKVFENGQVLVRGGFGKNILDS